MGYTNLELGLYLQRRRCSDSMPFVLMAVAAVFLQVISNQKFIGYALFILVFVLQTVLVSVHLEHNLYTFAGAPALTYSDMNGFGHFLLPWAWFNVYWSVFAAMLLVISAAFWVRGSRRRGAVAGITRCASCAAGKVRCWVRSPSPSSRSAAGSSTTPTCVNEYLPSDVVLDRQARFEKEYRKYKDLPQPRITDVYADVDIYPAERRVAIRGRYQLVNKTAEPIRDLHVTLLPRRRVARDVDLHRRRAGLR